MTPVNDATARPTPAPDQTIPAERVWEIIAAIDIAMLITHSADGLRGRPMSTIPAPEKGTIFVLTEADSPAADDVRKEGKVFLAYQGRGDHVALRGQATVVADKGLVKDLWNPGAQVFWPGGSEEHDIVALAIDPGHADVWDGHGLLRGIASIVKGAVGGQSPDLGTRGAVDL